MDRVCKSYEINKYQKKIVLENKLSAKCEIELNE